MNSRILQISLGRLVLSFILIAILGCEGVGTGSFYDASKSGAVAPIATEGFSPPWLASAHFQHQKSAADEVWVIARPQQSMEQSRAQVRSRMRLSETPLGDEVLASNCDFELSEHDQALVESVSMCGGIVGVPSSPAEKRLVHVPLEHTDVRAEIAAYIATVNLTQQFHNPYDGKIEAVYVFPLPQDAAVNEFVMTIGERKIRGIIREREEAERIYEEAKRQGYNAALMTQQRPNIFIQKVANIEPGRGIDVAIRYFHTLPYDDGWYEFVFPMVVGPRFNPPGRARRLAGASWHDPVRALPYSTGRTDLTPSDSHGTDVHYLRPDERSGHDIALTVEIDAGVEVEEIACASHEIETTAQTSTRQRVRLSPLDSIPNRDFVLRYRVAGDRIKTALMTYRDPQRYNGIGHFTLMIYPPRQLKDLERQPVEMIFVMDCSGSMTGEPLALAKKAVTRALHRLNPSDSFQVIRFSDRATQLGPRPLSATQENLQRGLSYVNSLVADGGTMMITGIRAALDFPRDDAERNRYVVFLTDGYIGNETEILGEMHSRLNGARVFSFGIGSSTNRFLLDRMATLGEGAAAYIGLNDSAAEVMDRFVERVAHPALEDIAIDFGSMRVSDVYPARTPDLFAGRPIILAGQFEGEGPALVRVDGRAGPRVLSIPLDVNMEHHLAGHGGIANVWARTKIAQMMNDDMVETNVETRDRVLALALEYGLVSAYTAFVAVDSSRRTEGDHGTTVNVGVPVPAGVRYETTVGN